MSGALVRPEVRLMLSLPWLMTMLGLVMLVLLQSTGIPEMQPRLWSPLKRIRASSRKTPHPWHLPMSPTRAIILPMAGLAREAVLTGRCAIAPAAAFPMGSSGRESLMGAGAPVRCAAIAPFEVGMDATSECPAAEGCVRWSYAITAPASASLFFGGLTFTMSRTAGMLVTHRGHQHDASAGVGARGEQLA